MSLAKGGQGGGTGIGLMAAQALVAAGAERVYIAGRRKEALETAAKEHGQGKMVCVEGDLTDRDSIQRVADQIKSAEGALALHSLVRADRNHRLSQRLGQQQRHRRQHARGRKG